MRAWLRNLFAPKPVSSRRTPARTRLGMESLEVRLNPAGYFMWDTVGEVTSCTFNATTGIISVVGTEQSEVIEVNRVTNPYDMWGFGDTFQVKVDGQVKLSVPVYTSDGVTPNVKSLNVDTRGGDDTVRNNTALSSTLNGGWGNDRVYGGSANDTLIGWVGDDQLSCGDGIDTAWGYDGNDTIWGDAGTDYLHGENGNDTIYAGRGNDVAWGDAGNDYIAGDEDNDVLVGGNGDDTMNGFDGTDTLYGEGGTDTLGGQNGNDRLYGSYGYDTLWGDEGDDYLAGDQENDQLHGGNGNDTLNGFDGNDTLWGDAGNDTLGGQNGNDTIYAGRGFDTAWGDDGDDYLAGDEDNDTLYGGNGNDTMNGFDGNDILYGDVGNDILGGQNGWDSLHGGFGNDVLYGDEGNDYLAGDQNDDTLIGGADADVLNGFDGNDQLHGDVGDTLSGGAGVDRLLRGATFLTGDFLRGDIEIVALGGVLGGSPQFTPTSCGPNSGFRLLYYHGIAVSYEQLLVDVTLEGDMISRLQLGTRPSVLLEALRKYRPETQLETRVDMGYGEGGLNRILELVASGKPVIALVNPTGRSQDIADLGFVTGGHIPESLHWVLVTGFDRATRTVTIMNTNGLAETWSFDTFNQRWNWSNGGAAGDFLTGTLGCPERTILY